MGSYAIITMNNERILTTATDSYPTGFGKDILGISPKTIEEIIELARPHGISFIMNKFLESENKIRIADIATRHTLSVEEVKEGIRRGPISMYPEDYLIKDISGYKGYAYYQYDYSDGKWRGRLIRINTRGDILGDIDWLELSEFIEEWDKGRL